MMKMMLPKEVKNILEGVHYFLVEDLKSETLSGKVECMRRGLLLQLEALKELFPLEFSTKFDPNANIRNSTSVSLPYLNTDQLLVNGSSRMSTSSSGSANYSTGYSNESSTGYSGDGIVSSHSKNGESDNAHSDFSSENYEDFDDVNKEPAIVPMNFVEPSLRKPSSDLQRQDSRASSGYYEDKEDQDDDCFVDVDPIPFRFLIAKCDYHGGLLKRSKGLLKTQKSFLGVLTGPHLYLYQKDTDDHQRKVIDLTGYEVRDCKKELKSRSKNRDFSFELIRPGRKTHTFYSAHRKDRELWIEHLKRATVATRSAYQVVSPISQRFPLTKVDEMTQQQNREVEKAEEAKEDDDEEADEDDENIYDDFYEELNLEADGSECQHKAVSIAPSSVTSVGVQNDLSYYYTVPDDETTKQTHEKVKKSPPERPPLPKVLIAQRPPAERPLPKAPEEVSYDEEDSADDIYCEIEGDESMESSNLLMCTHSLSQEIFDTINQRVTPLPEYNQCLTSLPSKYSPNSSPEREEEGEFESYDVPSDVSIFSVPPNRFKTYRTPSLPPKGIPNTHIDDDDDSDYKVPTFCIFPDNIYNVPPSNPVAVIQEPVSNDNIILDEPFVVNEESSAQNEVLVDSELDPCDNDSPNKNPTDTKKVTIIQCPPEVKGICNSIGPTETESENDMQSKQKTDQKQLDICTSSSVKDLIAKLNQNESQRDSFSSRSYGSFKNKIYEPNKLLVSDQKEKGGGTTDVAVEKEMEIATKENSQNYDLEKNYQYTVTKIKNKTIENKAEITENLKNKFTNFIDKNFPIISPASTKTESPNEDTARDKLSVYIAKFAFVSIDPETLSFSRGDEIIVKETMDEARWWKGTIKGKEGLVPREYLRKKEEVPYLDSNA